MPPFILGRALDIVQIYLPNPLAAAQLPEPPPPEQPRGRTDLRTRWDDGPVLESAAGEFGFRIGGRVQADASGFTAGDGPNLPPALGGLNPPLSGAANFRRARLRAGGRLAAATEWAAEFDFANQMTAYNAAFPTLTGNIPPKNRPYNPVAASN